MHKTCSYLLPEKTATSQTANRQPLNSPAMDVPGIALITGAASGIGAATALALARDGCTGLALCDMNPTLLTSTATTIAKTHPNLSIQSYTLNVTSEEQVNTTVAAVHKHFGRIDYLITCAGIAKKHPDGAASASSEDWHRVLDVNLHGTFYVFRAVANIMLAQTPLLSALDGRELQRGSIVMISSILGLVAVPMSTAYTASKHAVMGLVKTASEDYAAKGLRINAVCPGYTETPMTMGDEIVRKVMAEKMQKDVPMRRMGRPEEIAEGCVWLCSGRATFVTGIGLAVDGGYTQR